jgi:hypothetical protein
VRIGCRAMQGLEFSREAASASVSMVFSCYSSANSVADGSQGRET